MDESNTCKNEPNTTINLCIMERNEGMHQVLNKRGVTSDMLERLKNEKKIIKEEKRGQSIKIKRSECEIKVKIGRKRKRNERGKRET